jgi:hypothetical protein
MQNNFLRSLLTVTSNIFSPKQQSTAANTPLDVTTVRVPFPTISEMAPDNTTRKDLFKGIMYYDSSSVLSYEQREALDSSGAREYFEDGPKIEWRTITHVFTNDLDFPGKQEAMKREGLVFITVLNLSYSINVF